MDFFPHGNCCPNWIHAFICWTNDNLLPLEVNVSPCLAACGLAGWLLLGTKDPLPSDLITPDMFFTPRSAGCFDEPLECTERWINISGYETELKKNY